jgi:hypothetical protein
LFVFRLIRCGDARFRRVVAGKAVALRVRRRPRSSQAALAAARSVIYPCKTQHFDAVLLALGGHGLVRTTHCCDDMERMLRETPRVFPVSAVSLHV